MVQSIHAKQDLTKGPIVSTLLLFAIPTLLSNILQSLNGSINTIWVGRFLGETALAATSNAFILMFLCFSLMFGFGMAATVMVGQNIGRGDIETARKAFGSSIGFCIIFSLIIGVLGWFYAPEILTFMGAPIEAYSLACDYLRVIFVSMPGTMLFVILMMGLRGAGDSMTPLWFMIVNVVLDVVLNPLFIIGVGPFPEMGIAGSAWASTIATYAALISMVIYIYIRDLPLRLRGQEWHFLIPQRQFMRVIVLKGFPMSLQMLVMSSAGMMMIKLVNHEGVTTAAAYNVSQQLWTYLQMPAMAVGAAVSAMAAQNLGAGLWNRIDKITISGAVITVVLVSTLLVLLFTFDRATMRVFLGAESPAVELGRHIQLLASWSYVFFGVAMVFFSTLRANGVVVVPLISLFVGLYPIRLGFYYFTYSKIAADAIWISFPVGSICILCFAILYYYFGHWRQATLISSVNFKSPLKKY